MPASFFDTNVLIYLTSSDAKKADRVEALLAAGGVISVQVLNEMTNVARRKLQLSWRDTRELLSTLRGLLTIQPLTVELHDSGLRLAERYGFPVYDSMIVAAALEADCDTLWSEDMHNGLVVEKRVRVANPFVSSK